MSRSIRVNPNKMDDVAVKEVQKRKRSLTKAEKSARRAEKDQDS